MINNINKRIEDAVYFVKASRRNDMNDKDILFLMSLHLLVPHLNYTQSELVVNIIEQGIA